MDKTGTISGDLPMLLDSAVSFRIVGVANRLNRSASAFYRSRFGVGVQEWRLIMVLGQKDGLTVGDAALAADIDTAAASRALRTLKDIDIVTLEATASRGRATLARLTDKGRDTFERMREESAHRAAQIVAGLSEAEIEKLQVLLCRVLENTGKLSGSGCEEDPAKIPRD